MNKVSILLPTYNDEKYIEKSIQSILNQSYSNWELLIGFNGTTDSSKEIVKKFTSDNRIIVYDFENEKGKPKTLNKLLNKASGDLIALQDGDDIWLPKKLEEQIKHIEYFDVIGTYISYINENEDYIGCPNLSRNHDEIIFKTKSGDNQLANSSVLLKKNNLIKIGGWDETLKGLEDFDMWLKLIKINFKFININKILVFHRLHSESNFNTQNFDINYILEKNK